MEETKIRRRSVGTAIIISILYRRSHEATAQYIFFGLPGFSYAHVLLRLMDILQDGTVKW